MPEKEKRKMIDFSSLHRFKDVQFKILTLIPEWASAYEVDAAAIERQIPIAHIWCNSNPKKAPKKDPVRFLNNWMRLAKKMGNLVNREPVKLYREEKPADDEVMTGEDFQAMRKVI